MPRPTQCAADLESRRVKGVSLHRTLMPCRQAGALQDSCPGAQNDGGGACGMVCSAAPKDHALTSKVIHRMNNNKNNETN